MEQWVKGGGERISFHKHNEAVKAEKDYIWSVSQNNQNFMYISRIVNIVC